MKSGRNLNLDVLRGLAILLVIGRHIWFGIPDGPMGTVARLWQFVGWVGVDLFFVLSGFLISGLLFNEVQKHGQIKVGHFLMRRGFKIYPAYLAFLGYCFFYPVMKAILKGDLDGAVLHERLSLLWPNLLFLQNYIGPIPWSDTDVFMSWTPTWSLAVEEHFYIILPFALFFLLKRNRLHFVPYLFVLVFIVSILSRWQAVRHWPPDTNYLFMASHHRFDALFGGVAIRYMAQFHPRRFARLGSHPWLWTALGLLAWLPLCLWDQMQAITHTLGLVLTLLGSSALLIGLMHFSSSHFGRAGAVVKRMAKGLGWIGFYSYSIYLWHVQVLWWVYTYFVAKWAGAAEPDFIQWLIIYGVAIAAAVMTGVFMTWCVERPCLALRERWWPSRAQAMQSN